MTLISPAPFWEIWLKTVAESCAWARWENWDYYWTPLARWNTEEKEEHFGILALQRWVKQSPQKLKHNDTQRGNFFVCIMVLRADYQEHRDLCCSSPFASQGCNLRIILAINAINIIEMAAKHLPIVKDNRPKPEERMKKSPEASIWFLYEAWTRLTACHIQFGKSLWRRVPIKSTGRRCLCASERER